MTRLNRQFLQHPGVTDVITFDYRDEPVPADDDEPPVIGEIFVCPEVAAAACRRQQTTFAYELVLYVVHGLLHLAGHDDHSAADRRRMRAAERRVMGSILKEFTLEDIFPV